jgi:S-adenosylmethionine-diacylglycerol 3-amino-3-carboxypropyl transferase
MAAIRRLEYQELVRFLGLIPAEESRENVYPRLRGDLSPGAAQFWDGQSKIIRDGFLLRGRYERFVKIIGAMVRLIHGRVRVNGLFDDRALDGQREFYDREWDILRTRLVFYLFYNKRVLSRIGLKPDYFHFDDGSNSFSESFRRKFRRVISEVPVRGNYFVHTYLKGCYRSLTEVPAYLREANVPMIKRRLDRIRIHTDDAKKWLADVPDDTFDVLALSNICELMSLSDTRKMFEEVLRTAKPGARISFRNLILPREVPEDLRANIRKNEPLSRELMATDRAFVYSKVAAYEVQK